MVIALIAVFFYERKRTTQFSGIANKIGFRIETGTQSLPQEIKATGFHLFNQPDIQIQNLIVGQKNNIQIQIFDFDFDAAFGSDAEPDFPMDDDEYIHYQQTVFYLKMPQSKIPIFDLSPTHTVLRQAGKLRDLTPVHFDNDSIFTQHYILLGREINQLKLSFNREVRAFLLQNKGITIESFGDRWIFYQLGQRIKPKNIPHFLEKIEQFLKITIN